MSNDDDGSRFPSYPVLILVAVIFFAVKLIQHVFVSLAQFMDFT